MGKKNPGWEGKTTKKWSQELIDSLKLKSSDNIVMFNKPFDKGLVEDFPIQEIGPKPTGVWYACGDEWIYWVWRNMEEWLGDYIYKLKIDKSNFVRIRNDKDFLAFNAMYRRPSGYIDWPFVAQTGFTGIEISPHIEDMRRGTGFFWYSAWDIASGCVWDTSCIKNVSIIEF